MKSCYNCGKVVADKTVQCPACGSYLFTTDENYIEGGWNYFMMSIFQKNQKAFWILLGLLFGGLALFLVLVFTS